MELISPHSIAPSFTHTPLFLSLSSRMIRSPLSFISILSLHLLLISFPSLILSSSLTSSSSSSCVSGVPSSGVIPSNWRIRPFTLIISSLTILNARNEPLAAIAANGTIPGPRLSVDYGDWVVVTVYNNLSSTSALHWHGMTLYTTPDMDGVASLTQCGIAAGGVMVYSFCAAPAGTYWYHGHLDEQYVEGLYGPLVVASADSSSLTASSLYSQDWVWQVQDFYNQPALAVLLPWFLSPVSEGQEPQPDTVMVNGGFSGSSHLYVSTNDSVVIRLINSGSLCMYVFSIDGVAMEVLELDGTEVSPISLQSVMLNVAQRAVVRVSFVDLKSRDPSLSAVFYRITMVPDADLTVDPFYPAYEANFTQSTNWTGVIHIDSPFSTALPTYTSWSSAMPTFPATAGIQMETNLLDARPLSYDAVIGGGVAVGKVPAATHELILEVAFANNADGVNIAYVNNVSYSMMGMTAVSRSPTTMTQSMMPMLYAAYINNSLAASSSSSSSSSASTIPGVITGDDLGNYAVPYGAVVDITILNTDTGEHPFHFHGNTFWIVATSDYPTAELLYPSAYLMRDTVSVPALGWARLRFLANNPGVWMLHCHIDWHMSAGLAVVLNVGLEKVTPAFMQLNDGSIRQCDAAIQQQLVNAQYVYAAAVNTKSSSSGLTSNGKIAVGVAVGLGVPLLALVVVFVFCICRRNTDSKQSMMQDGKPSQSAAHSVSQSSDVELGGLSEDSTIAS